MASSSSITNPSACLDSSPPSPALSKFKIALCQLTVISNKGQNLARARMSVESAVEKGAKLVVLPEMWNCPYSNDCVAEYAEDFDDVDASPSISLMSELAHAHGITIVGGSVPERSGDRLYNTCCVFGPDGNLKAKHRKLHLFDMEVEGEFSYKESDMVTAGDRTTLVDTDVGRIGVGICHDIRFPELAMLYKQKGAHLLCYPGAFNVSTGEALWEIQQRGRATDNQLYVATCSPSRDSTFGYVIWGHSMVVAPSGEIVASTGYDEAVVVTEIDYSEITLQRRSLPLEKHRRGDVYQLN